MISQMSDGFILVFTFSCRQGWINQSSVVKLPLDLDPVQKKIKATLIPAFSVLQEMFSSVCLNCSDIVLGLFSAPIKSFTIKQRRCSSTHRTWVYFEIVSIYLYSKFLLKSLKERKKSSSERGGEERNYSDLYFPLSNQQSFHNQINVVLFQTSF